jgi:hypothetical protein
MTATSERFDMEAERRRLGAMTAGELRQRDQEIGGDDARSRNREELIRRILWMLQAGAHGGLNERAVALADGFEFKGERYGSLSAIAKAVTGMNDIATHQ